MQGRSLPAESGYYTRLGRLAATAAVGPTTFPWMRASAIQRHLRSRVRSESECVSARRGARARVYSWLSWALLPTVVTLVVFRLAEAIRLSVVGTFHLVT